MGSVLTIIISARETNKYINKKREKIKKINNIFEPRCNNLGDVKKEENKEENIKSPLLIIR